MKIRIGIGIGSWPFPGQQPERFFNFVQRCDDLGIDSLWFSDHTLSRSDSVDPVVAMTAVAAHSSVMKFGTSILVLPIRHPVLLAKELASLDHLSNGRLLLVVGLGHNTPVENKTFGLYPSQRGLRTDEMIVSLRKIWEGENVTFNGRFHDFQNVTITPPPLQKPTPPIWIGGRSEAAMKRTGHLGDGWLPATITPREYEKAMKTIQRHARDVGRAVPEDHYGVYLSCAISDNQAKALQLAAPYLPSTRKDTRPENYHALGTPQDIAKRLKDYVSVGVSKFVLRPACPPELWVSKVEELAREIIQPLQTPAPKKRLSV